MWCAKASRDRVANVNRSAGTVRRIQVAGSNHGQVDAVTCTWARPMRLERVQRGRVGGLRRWPLRRFMAPGTAKIDGPRRVVDIGGAPVVGKITCRPENDNDVMAIEGIVSLLQDFSGDVTCMWRQNFVGIRSRGLGEAFGRWSFVGGRLGRLHSDSKVCAAWRPRVLLRWHFVAKFRQDRASNDVVQGF